MDEEKIGLFIAKLRKESKMTQKELAEKIGVTDRAISNWENGRRIPDVSLYQKICETFGITLNELFSGERVEDKNFKEVADKNLFSALENSVFTLKDKIDYFKRKWQRDHFFELTLTMIIIVFFIIYGFIKDNDFQYLFMIIGLISSIIENNRMMAYIECNAYGKKSDITIEEFRSYINGLTESKDILKTFKNKKEAVKYLMKTTNLSEQECSSAYDIIIKLDLEKIS